jgi:hypothetical protein
MSVQEQLHSEATRQREPDELFHHYPACWGEPGEHIRASVPGDVATCGYIKRRPSKGRGEWGRSDACVVCETLAHKGRVRR